jgi:hypothetical protein
VGAGARAVVSGETRGGSCREKKGGQKRTIGKDDVDHADEHPVLCRMPSVLDDG